MKDNRVCLYSHVENKSVFKNVCFYRDDLIALERNYNQALATNSYVELIKFKPSLVVSYFFTWSLLVAFLGRFIGFRVIIIGMGDQISPDVYNGLRLLLCKITAFLCLLLSEKILVSCSNDKNNLYKLCFGFNFLKKKIRLENLVVVPFQYKETREHKNFKALTICWLGNEKNLIRKGVDCSIRLIFLLRSIGINASLDIAGLDGPGKTIINKLIEEYQLKNYVNYIGFISESEKNALMSSHSVYLQLSDYEGFGMAALEALFSGMVVIHSNAGGLKDHIGSNGIITDKQKIYDSNLNYIAKIYSSFLEHSIDQKYMLNEIEKYSIRRRSAAFL